jgi:hypothetical protein
MQMISNRHAPEWTPGDWLLISLSTFIMAFTATAQWGMQ